MEEIRNMTGPEKACLGMAILMAMLAVLAVGVACSAIRDSGKAAAPSECR